MFFSIIFGLKLTNIGPHSTTSTEKKRNKNNGKNKQKQKQQTTTTTYTLSKGDNKSETNKKEVEIEGSMREENKQLQQQDLYTTYAKKNKHTC